jgi:hypothetical protein
MVTVINYDLLDSPLADDAPLADGTLLSDSALLFLNIGLCLNTFEGPLLS